MRASFDAKKILRKSSRVNNGYSVADESRRIISANKTTQQQKKISLTPIIIHFSIRPHLPPCFSATINIPVNSTSSHALNIVLPSFFQQIINYTPGINSITNIYLVSSLNFFDDEKKNITEKCDNDVSSNTIDDYEYTFGKFLLNNRSCTQGNSMYQNGGLDKLPSLNINDYCLFYRKRNASEFSEYFESFLSEKNKKKYKINEIKSRGAFFETNLSKVSKVFEESGTSYQPKKSDSIPRNLSLSNFDKKKIYSKDSGYDNDILSVEHMNHATNYDWISGFPQLKSSRKSELSLVEDINYDKYNMNCKKNLFFGYNSSPSSDKKAKCCIKNDYIDYHNLLFAEFNEKQNNLDLLDNFYNVNDIFLNLQNSDQNFNFDGFSLNINKLDENDILKTDYIECPSSAALVKFYKNAYACDELNIQINEDDNDKKSSNNRIQNSSIASFLTDALSLTSPSQTNSFIPCTEDKMLINYRRHCQAQITNKIPELYVILSQTYLKIEHFFACEINTRRAILLAYAKSLRCLLNFELIWRGRSLALQDFRRANYEEQLQISAAEERCRDRISATEERSFHKLITYFLNIYNELETGMMKQYLLLRELRSKFRNEIDQNIEQKEKQKEDKSNYFKEGSKGLNHFRARYQFNIMQ